MKCNGAHCKCMNLGGNCPNNHYATCAEHSPKTTPPMRTSEITKENLRVGDVLWLRKSLPGGSTTEDEYRIISFLNDDLVALGYFGDEESIQLFEIKRLRESKKWHFYPLPEPNPHKQQLTRKQIEERLGYEIEIIKE